MQSVWYGGSIYMRMAKQVSRASKQNTTHPPTHLPPTTIHPHPTHTLPTTQHYPPLSPPPFFVVNGFVSAIQFLRISEQVVAFIMIAPQQREAVILRLAGLLGQWGKEIAGGWVNGGGAGVGGGGCCGCMGVGGRVGGTSRRHHPHHAQPFSRSSILRHRCLCASTCPPILLSVSWSWSFSHITIFTITWGSTH